MKDFIEFAKRQPSWALYGAGTAMIGIAMAIQHGIAAGLGATGLLAIFGAVAASIARSK